MIANPSKRGTLYLYERTIELFLGKTNCGNYLSLWINLSKKKITFISYTKLPSEYEIQSMRLLFEPNKE